MNGYGLTRIMLTIGMIVLTGCRASKPIPTTPTKVAFQAKYPEQRSDNELYTTAVDSREPLIYGRMTDPLGNAKRISALYPLLEETVAKVNRNRLHKLSTARYAGLLFLEGGGQQFALTAKKNETLRAAGVAQFIPSTAQHYHLVVNFKQSVVLRRKRQHLLLQLAQKQRRLHTALKSQPIKTVQALAIGQAALGRIEGQLAQIDERFNRRKAVYAGAEYLADHLATYGREDWAIQAYHAGSRSVQRVLKYYTQGTPLWCGSAERTLQANNLTWSKLLFDVTPSKHPRTFSYLRRTLGDQSWDYSLRVDAAAKAVRLYRTQPTAFWQRLQFYYRAKQAGRGWPLAREMEWYPPNSAVMNNWQTWRDLKGAFETGELVRLPDQDSAFSAIFGLRVKEAGEFAGKDVPKWLYRLIRPEAAGVLCYLGSAVRRESDEATATISVASMARSAAYQRRLKQSKLSPALYSAHRTGMSFDLTIPRDQKVKQVLEYLLWDLRYRGVIVWFFEGARSGFNRHYHVTVSPGPRGQVFKQVWADAMQHYLLVKGGNVTLETARPGHWPWWKWTMLVWAIITIFAWFLFRDDPEMQGGKSCILALLTPGLLVIVAIMYCFGRRERQGPYSR